MNGILKYVLPEYTWTILFTFLVIGMLINLRNTLIYRKWPYLKDVEKIKKEDPDYYSKFKRTLINTDVKVIPLNKMVLPVMIIINYLYSSLLIENLYRYFLIHTALFVFITLKIIIVLTVKEVDYILPHVKRRDAKGLIYIGNIATNLNNRKFKINLKDLRSHVFITGLTGSGKTNLVKLIIIQITELNKPFILVEFKGDYGEFGKYIPDIEILKPGINFTLNIFDPLDEPPERYAEYLYEMLTSAHIFTLNTEYSVQMEKVLIDILRDTCADPERRNWEGFDYYTGIYLKKYVNKIPSLNQTIIAINNRLRRFKSGALKNIFYENNKPNLDELLRKKIIIELGSIIKQGGEKSDAVFFANILFTRIWQANLKRGRTGEIRHFTILEDAQFFISKRLVNGVRRTHYLEDFALLLRGTGECLITINTRPNISEDIMANAGVIIAFNTTYDRELMGKLLSLNESKFFYLSKLKTGECIVKTNSISDPFVIRVPLITPNILSKRNKLRDKTRAKMRVKKYSSQSPIRKPNNPTYKKEYAVKIRNVNEIEYKRNNFSNIMEKEEIINEENFVRNILEKIENILIQLRDPLYGITQNTKIEVQKLMDALTQNKERLVKIIHHNNKTSKRIITNLLNTIIRTTKKITTGETEITLYNHRILEDLIYKLKIILKEESTRSGQITQSSNQPRTGNTVLSTDNTVKTDNNRFISTEGCIEELKKILNEDL